MEAVGGELMADFSSGEPKGQVDRHAGWRGPSRGGLRGPVGCGLW